MTHRVGFGYDIHRLEEGKELIIGGVKIPHYKKAAGHSDADVLMHAICDALLGAAALGDIGTHFPDTDIQYKNADSSLFLKKVYELLKKKGFRIGNIDSTIILEKPKIKEYIGEIRCSLAKILETEESNISVKATTNEKLDATGREEGIAACATALIFKKVQAT